MTKTLLLLLASLSLAAQTFQPVPLRVYTQNGIAADTIIDNRSTVNRSLRFVTIACSGSGTWSAALLYGATTASFTSYGSAASVDQSDSTPTAWGFLFTSPNYIKVDLTGTVTCNLSGFKDLYATGDSGGSVTYPIPVASGGTGATDAATARANLGITDSNSVILTEYDWTRTPGGSVSVGANTVTLTTCPLGVAGTNADHYVYLSGGTGTAESVLITGGTCTSGAATGTITFTAANTHTGAWTVSSASTGLQEAIYSVADGAKVAVVAPEGAYNIYATVSGGTRPVTISCDSLGAIFYAKANSIKLLDSRSGTGPQVSTCTMRNDNNYTGVTAIYSNSADGPSSGGAFAGSITGNWFVNFDKSIHSVTTNGWHILDNQIISLPGNNATAGIHTESLTNGDQGTGLIAGNIMTCSATCTYGLLWNGPGALQLKHNNLNGYSTQVHLQPAFGTASSSGSTVTWVSGNTFRSNWVGQTIYLGGTGRTIASVDSDTQITTSTAIGTIAATDYYVNVSSQVSVMSNNLDAGTNTLYGVRWAGTVLFQNAQIEGNFFSNWSAVSNHEAISVVVGTNLNFLSVKNNNIQSDGSATGTYGVRIRSGYSLGVQNNQIVGSKTGVSIETSASEVKVSGNQCTLVGTACITSSDSTLQILESQSVTYAELSTLSAASGSRIYCSNCSNVCSTAGSGATASRINGAWKCSTGALDHLVNSDFNFATTNGSGVSGDLSATGSKTITFTACPLGLNGANSANGHWLRISGGTGTAEKVNVTGGTCSNGSTSGTIIFTTTQTHTGSWIVSSATAGIQEAFYYVDPSTNPANIQLAPGDWSVYGPILLWGPGGKTVQITGSGNGATRLVRDSSYPSGDLLYYNGALSSGQVMLNNFSVLNANGFDNPSGAGIHLYITQLFEATLIDVTVFNGVNPIVVDGTGSGSVSMDRVYAYILSGYSGSYTTGDGITINVAEATLSNTRSSRDVKTATGGSGLKIIRADGIRILGGHYNGTYGIHVANNPAYVFNFFYADNVIIDETYSNGIYFAIGATNAIYGQVRIQNCHFATQDGDNAAAGIYIGSALRGLTIDGNNISGFEGPGIVLGVADAAPLGVVISNNQINNNGRTSSRYGIIIPATGTGGSGSYNTNTIISGNVIGNNLAGYGTTQEIGIYFSGSAGKFRGYSITGNSIYGNTAAAILKDATPTIEQIVETTNGGITDTVTLIASASLSGADATGMAQTIEVSGTTNVTSLTPVWDNRVITFLKTDAGTVNFTAAGNIAAAVSITTNGVLICQYYGAYAKWMCK